MFDILKEISISEKMITDTNHDKIKNAMSYLENHLIDSDGFDVKSFLKLSMCKIVTK